jgi:hypothetical protein
MVTESVAPDIAAIGSVAGLIWNFLEANGPVPVSRLVKDIDAPRDVVMQGVGWLAREGKVRFEESSRRRLIALT